METRSILLFDETQNLVEILKEIAYDLSFLIVLYNVLVKWRKQIVDIYTIQRVFRNTRLIILQVLQLASLLKFSKNRILLFKHIRKSLLISVDNMF